MTTQARLSHPVAALVALAVLVTGCAVPFEDLNDVDAARRAQLIIDPWLDPDSISTGGPRGGTNLLYYPAGGEWERQGIGGFVEVANAEVAGARAQGWEPVFGRCPLPPGVEPDNPDLEDALTGVDVVLNGTESGTLVFSRPTGDGATAVTALSFVRATPAPVGAADAYDITLSAWVPRHATIPTEPPPVVDLSRLVCWGQAGDQWQVGDSETFRSDGW